MASATSSETLTFTFLDELSLSMKVAVVFLNISPAKTIMRKGVMRKTSVLVKLSRIPPLEIHIPVKVVLEESVPKG